MKDERPNPDELLRAITREEQKVRRGRLKVFLGMAAGVGKTYAMLEDAQNQLAEGRDVVVGLVNTHGRIETERLLIGLTCLPLKKMEYKGTIFEEMDLEAVLERKPELVLVDELAHTNIPGSRHVKRYQDVLELIEKGIDVATTVNVQHIESLKDIIEQITGVQIRETVPDKVLESADYIELLDLTPTDLLERLKEGKVYLGPQAEMAITHFFQEDRLTALREIVLRYAAEKVDHDLQLMVSTTQRTDSWKPRERLMVAVSHSPHSQKLIRATRRLAFSLDAPWIAVHVDDGRGLSPEDAQCLAKNLKLARDLGAEVITTQDPDVAENLERIARQKHITQIIVGRSPQKRLFGLWNRSSLLDRLAQDCKDIDVHVIRQAALPKAPPRGKIFDLQQGAAYLFTFCAVWLLTFINMIIVPYVGYKVVGCIFLLGILSLCLIFKKGPVFFGAILFGLIWDYFFIPPVGSFAVGSTEDIVLLALYVLTAITTGVLTDRARSRKEMLIKREKTTEALYEIVRHIADSPTPASIAERVQAHLNTIVHGKCLLLIRNESGKLQGIKQLDEKERATATWVFDNGKEAGWSTPVLPLAQNLYLPLRGYTETMGVGVLVYTPDADGTPLTSEEKNFLYAAGQQLAYYLERRLAVPTTGFVA